MRVAALQMRHGDSLEANLAAAASLVDDARSAGCRLAVLPEYFFASFRGAPEADAARVRSFLKESSRGLALAGHAVERRDGVLRGMGLLYDRGREVLGQAKAQVMGREAGMGLQGSDAGFATAPLDGHATGILVCADILFPEAATVLGALGAELVLNPVMSSHHAADPTRAARESLYVARAYDARAFVVKAGGYRLGEPRIVGRSLVAAPWGLLARYRDDAARELVVADLDFAALAEFREGQRRFPARRPEAYWQLRGGA
jgi:predicted amidohydrolase